MNREPPDGVLAPPSASRVATVLPNRAESRAGDVLYGAEEIASFLFGDRRYRRRVYTRAAKAQLPVFRIGTSICARKSVLLAWMAQQEARRQTVD